MEGGTKCICKRIASAYIPNKHDIIFELKPTSRDKRIFYMAQQHTTACNKNTSAEGTGLWSVGTEPACPSLCARRDAPCSGPAPKQNAGMCCTGNCGQLCLRGAGEGGLPEGHNSAPGGNKVGLR